MLHAMGSGKVQSGSAAWYDYLDRVNELAEQRDAYNNGMMGVLDGETAQERQEEEQRDRIEVTDFGEEDTSGFVHDPDRQKPEEVHSPNGIVYPDELAEVVFDIVIKQGLGKHVIEEE